MRFILSVVLLAVGASALPTDPVIYKLDEQRYHYAIDGDGKYHLVDLWVKASDLEKMARFTPDSENVYHLFTRTNPSVSQVLISGSTASVTSSNFDASKRTAVVIHGWLNSATSDVNTVVVPGFLSGEDMNVIVVDWSAGAGTIDYTAAVTNTVPSGESVARFITWLNSVTGATLSSYHIAGHSLGGHQAGIVGRNLGGEVAYITALDPAMLGWTSNDDKFVSTDGVYTEVIHTSAGITGYLTPMGDADFYPNGGITMPGCSNNPVCDHGRSYFYFGESLATGGFTGTRCSTYLTAVTGNCYLWGSLNMGGITPKTGQSGIYYLETNAGQPFSQG